MGLWRQMARGIRVLANPRAAERDVRDEVAHYVAMAGSGHRTQMEEEVRSYGWENAVSGTLADLRHGARLLRAHPGFTVAAVLTLAVGIGANTAAFSVVNAVLLRPLRYADSGRLYTLYEAGPNGVPGRLSSYPTFMDWREASHAFGAMAFVRGKTAGLRGADGIENVIGAWVSPGFFSVLTPRSIQGRTFTPDEERAGARVAVITARFCQSHFGTAAAAIGRTLDLGDGVYNVIGVLPAGVEYPPWAEIFMPLQVLQGLETALTHRGLHVDSRVVGRLAPGVTERAARAELDAIEARLSTTYPGESRGWTRVALVGLKNEMLGLVAGNSESGIIQRAILVLAGAIGLILLIACANLANLSLARATSRTREMAVRAALGAGRARIVRQLLTESALLAAVGAGAGCLLAAWGVRALRVSLPGVLPRLSEVSVDAPALVFTVALTLITVLAFGLAPAIRGSAPEATLVLKSGGRAIGGGSRARAALVTFEMALALVLLAGAGLLLRSFWLVSRVDLGFDPAHVVTLGIFPPAGRTADRQWPAPLYRRVQEAVAAVPGVEYAALTNNMPLGGGLPSRVLVPGHEPRTDGRDDAFFREASPDYFTAMRIAVKAGRTFTPDEMTPDAHVAVVNEELARRLFPNESAVGRQVTLHRASQGREDYGQPFAAEIVGVVATVRNVQLEAPGDPEVYVPYPANPWSHMSLVVRTSGPAGALLPALRRATLAAEPDLPGVAGPKGFVPMEDSLAGLLSSRRLTTMLLVSFALCALFLAMLGIYGVVAYGVAQRTREIGIRAALGATHARIALLVLGQSAAMVAAGIACGVAIALALSRLLARLLFGVTPTDPLTFGAVALLLAVVALSATYLPLRRALKVDALVALRTGD